MGELTIDFVSRLCARLPGLMMVDDVANERARLPRSPRLAAVRIHSYIPLFVSLIRTHAHSQTSCLYVFAVAIYPKRVLLPEPVCQSLLADVAHV